MLYFSKLEIWFFLEGDLFFNVYEYVGWMLLKD